MSIDPWFHDPADIDTLVECKDLLYKDNAPVLPNDATLLNMTLLK